MCRLRRAPRPVCSLAKVAYSSRTTATARTPKKHGLFSVLPEPYLGIQRASFSSPVINWFSHHVQVGHLKTSCSPASTNSSGVSTPCVRNADVFLAGVTVSLILFARDNMAARCLIALPK